MNVPEYTAKCKFAITIQELVPSLNEMEDYTSTKILPGVLNGRLRAETAAVNSRYMFKHKMLNSSLDTDFCKTSLSLGKI